MATASGFDAIKIRKNDEEVDITPYVIEVVWTDCIITGGWSWSLRFRTDDWYFFRDLFYGRDTADAIYLRLETTDDTGNYITNWRRAYVDHSASSLLGEANTMIVKGGDARLLMQSMEKTRVWKSTLASDVIQAVAADYQFETDIEESAALADHWQLRATDWDFLRQLAAKTAVKSRRGDTFLTFVNGVLRFFAPTFAGSAQKIYRFTSEDLRVTGLSVSQHGRQVDRMGGGRQITIGFDPKTGTFVRDEYDHTEDLARPAQARYLSRRPSLSLRVNTVMSHDSASVVEENRAFWGRHGTKYYRAVVTARADLGVEVAKPVLLVAPTSDQSGMYGAYTPYTVTHHMHDKRAMTTTLSLYRREAGYGDIQVSAVDNTNSSAPYQSTETRSRAYTTITAESLD